MKAREGNYRDPVVMRGQCMCGLHRAHAWNEAVARFGWLFGVVMLAVAFAGCDTLVKLPMSYGSAAALPKFVGESRSPSGQGVDLCLHPETVRKNPHGNPSLAWNDEHCFTIMGHGLLDSPYGPYLLDERETQDSPLYPEDLIWEILADPVLRNKLANSQCVLLYACDSGAETDSGAPPFARQLADRLRKPVIAPTRRLWMNGGRGKVQDGGVFEVFYPMNAFHK